jgi:signal transduction histidine kinase/FixJ family two-component response regulator
MNKKTILCVDDEKPVLDSLKDQLRKEFATDYNIEMAQSGDEAIEVFNELLDEGQDIPVVISDHLMPGMKGDELLIRLHELSPRTKKIMLTGHAGGKAIGNALNKANLYRYIAKPWDTEDLIITITEAIKSYNQQKALNTIIGIGQHITSILDIKELLRTIIVDAVRVTEAQRGYLFLLNKESKELEVKADLDTSDKELPNISMIIINKVFNTGKDYLIVDDNSLNDDNISYKELINSGIKSILCVPLRHHNRLLGVCYLDNSLTGTYFTSNNLEFLKTFASQAAIAIDNANVYENMENIITERTQQLENKTRELSKAYKELEAFSHRVSHDLKNPVNAINSCRRLILSKDEKSLSPDSIRYFDYMKDSIDHVFRIIESLLSLSKAQSNHMDIVKVNLSIIVKNIVKELQLSNTERKAQFIIQDDVYTMADENLISIALNNIISNAWKYSSELDKTVIEFGQTDELKGKVPSQIKKDKPKTVYFVKDNGIGFDMKWHDQIFRAFQRIEIGKHYDGSGIGLATVVRIIERHDGYIWADSEPGKGSTFYFTLNKSDP